MTRIAIDASGWAAKANALEQRVLPKVILLSLNDAAFGVREDWAAEIPRIFDRPTQLTMRAPLYRKATADNLTAEVWIRDEVAKGTPPSRYLSAQVFGGDRSQKSMEKALESNVGLPPFYVPSSSAPKDAHGNLPRGISNRILSQLRANRMTEQRETATKRTARLRRQQRRGGGGSYFVLPANRGRLRAHVIYERIDSAFGSGVRAILIPQRSAPRYRVRYNVFDLAQRLFFTRFERAFTAQLKIFNVRDPRTA